MKNNTPVSSENQDGSLVSFAVSLGGVVRSVVDMRTGEICEPEGGEPRERGGSLPGSSLSTYHIRPGIKVNVPVVEAYEGAGLIKVSRIRWSISNPARRTVKRGAVKTFSKASRRRLMRTVAKVKRSAVPVFVTLTYPDKFSPDAVVWKRDFSAFIKRLSRKYSGVCGVWKLEPQKRGAPHFHLLIWGVSVSDLRLFVPMAWYEVVGSGDVNHLLWHLGQLGNGNKHCVQAVKSWRGVMSYASKYLGKVLEDVEGWENPGRFWGVFGRAFMPFGDLVLKEITEKTAVEALRYIRRFMRLRGRDYKSLSVMCDADFWIARLL